VDVDVRRSKIAKRNRLLDPSQHVVPGAALIVAEIVVEADLGDAAGLEERDHLVGPACRDPTGRRRATIIKKYLHGSGVLYRTQLEKIPLAVLTAWSNAAPLQALCAVSSDGLEGGVELDK